MRLAHAVDGQFASPGKCVDKKRTLATKSTKNAAKSKQDFLAGGGALVSFTNEVSRFFPRASRVAISSR